MANGTVASLDLVFDPFELGALILRYFDCSPRVKVFFIKIIIVISLTLFRQFLHTFYLAINSLIKEPAAIEPD